MPNVFGAEFRRAEDRDHLGKPSRVAVAERTYDTTVEDLWEAITTKERLQRWFLPIEGELRLGGQYRLEGNASGTIERCDPPERLEVTWEFAGHTSWVHLQLSADDGGAKLHLEHISPRDAGSDAHYAEFGPGATGVGWDLSLHGLERHLAAPQVALDREAFEAWTVSAEGKRFVRESGEAWCHADVAAGVDEADARARAERTIAFYSGSES